MLRISGLLVAQICIASAWNTFVVPHADGKDDTPGLNAALANFTTDSTILFQKGVKYNVFTPITFPVLNNVEIRIEGNLSYPTDIPTIQGGYCLAPSYYIDPLTPPSAIVASSVSSQPILRSHGDSNNTLDI